MRLAASCLVGAALLLSGTRALAIGEVITDIKVENNARTLEETVRSIAGMNIGDALEIDTLDKVRERLHTSGLFADVNVYWTPHRDGVRVVILIKDKFPWAPVPTVSFSPGNRSAGLIIGHGNLFGRGKRGIIGGRYSNVDSGALAAYDDPALFGTWMFLTMSGRFQDQLIPEYANRNDTPGLPLIPVRETKLRAFGGAVNLGVAWFRKVRTSVGWFGDKTRILRSDVKADNPWGITDLPIAAEGAVRGAATANVTFDFRAREHAVMYGNSLSFTLDYGSPTFGSDDKIEYWKAGALYEQGIRFFRRHNLIVRAGGHLGDNMPLWSENFTTGSNPRGFVYYQYMGDTHLRTQVDYHFPLFSIKQLDVRGLVFNDASAIWYRNLPPIVDGADAYEARRNGRSYLPPSVLIGGFDAQRDIHISAGVGLRFYLRSVSAPLVGLDFGHGIGTGTVRMVLMIGA